MDGLDEIKSALAELKDAAGAVAEVKTLREGVAEMKKELAAVKTELKEDLADLAARRDVKRTGTADAAETERKAVAAFVRTGDDAELKAMSAGSNPDGGFTVLPTMANAVNAKLFDRSAMARLARRITIDGGSYEEPLDTDDLEAAWVAEKTARPPLASPTLDLLRVPLHEISTTQLVTQKLLDLSRFDLGGWLEGKIADKFARAEGAAMMTGDGVARPKGLLTYPTSTAADAARPWGTIQYVPTGTEGGFSTTAGAGANNLIDLAYALRSPYRPRARWLMNSKTAGAIRKLRDGDGSSIWSESLAEGQASRLLGYPVELDEEMPDMASGAFSIAFGDIAAAYTMVENGGMRMMRDPYSDKPHVIFYAYRRVGGGLANSEAVKFLKFSTT